MSFAKKFCGKSPFKHGDGSGVSPAGQQRMDIKSKYYDKHGSNSGGSDEEWKDYQTELAGIED
tara:strand:+ start:60 stop:248 length:189 start_codon:yes stop_codon:yes gene_type:complete